MPMRPPTLCAGGCGRLVTAGHCPHCRPQVDHAKDARRGTATARGYGAKWRTTSAAFLRRHPLCVRCQAAGRTAAATVTDHIVPHRGDLKLFWDRTNWQPLCTTCHGQKTATEVHARTRQRTS